MTPFLFVIFGLTSLTAAVAAVTRKNPVASAIWLVVMFFGLAGNYVLLEAYFVAIVQVLVYAGAIMVLFLFVIMLLDLRQEVIEGERSPRWRLAGVVAAVLFLTATGIAVYDAVNHTEVFDQPVVDLDGSAAAIGKHIFERWLLAFEVTSILLLAGILGAVILTKRRLT